MSLTIADTLGRAAAAAVLALALGHASAADEAAASASQAGPPAGFVVPADPKPDDTNAQRAQSQPGNNAPMWRKVHGSGDAPGITQVEGSEAGTLIASVDLPERGHDLTFSPVTGQAVVFARQPGTFAVAATEVVMSVRWIRSAPMIAAMKATAPPVEMSNSPMMRTHVTPAAATPRIATCLPRS